MPFFFLRKVTFFIGNFTYAPNGFWTHGLYPLGFLMRGGGVVWAGSHWPKKKKREKEHKEKMNQT